LVSIKYWLKKQVKTLQIWETIARRHNVPKREMGALEKRFGKSVGNLLGKCLKIRFLSKAPALKKKPESFWKHTGKVPFQLEPLGKEAPAQKFEKC
jgi:hypothetical protein